MAPGSFALRFCGRALALTGVGVLLLEPLRPFLVTVGVRAAQSILRATERPPLIGRLDVRGDQIAIWAPSLGVQDPIGLWDGSTLPLLLLGPLVAAAAVPRLAIRRRAPLLGWAAIAGFLAMATVASLQIEAAVANHAAARLALHPHSDPTRWALQAGQDLIGALLFGLPAAFAAAGAWAARAPRTSWLESSLGRLALGAMAVVPLVLAMAPVGPLHPGHVGARLRLHVERNPDSPEALRALALWVQTEEGSAAAIEPFHRASKAAPDDARTTLLLADALAGAGRMDEAVSVYHRSLELDPSDLTARYNLGVVLTRLERRDEALAAYEEVLEIDPDHRPARIAAGLSRAAAGEPCRALAWLEPIAEDDVVAAYLPTIRAQCGGES